MQIQWEEVGACVCVWFVLKLEDNARRGLGK